MNEMQFCKIVYSNGNWNVFPRNMYARNSNSVESFPVSIATDVEACYIL